jgi:hypothetical protein
MGMMFLTSIFVVQSRGIFSRQATESSSSPSTPESIIDECLSLRASIQSLSDVIFKKYPFLEFLHYFYFEHRSSRALWKRMLKETLFFLSFFC